MDICSIYKVYSYTKIATFDSDVVMLHVVFTSLRARVHTTHTRARVSSPPLALPEGTISLPVG
jgi:hypothetical protein